MHVKVDAKCMCTKFWWAWPFWFRSYGSILFSFKKAKVSLQTKAESAQKIHAKWVAKIPFSFNFS